MQNLETLSFVSISYQMYASLNAVHSTRSCPLRVSEEEVDEAEGAIPAGRVYARRRQFHSWRV